MITNKISENAIKIRLMLMYCGETPVEELMDICGLTQTEFYLALGWLTREGWILYYERGTQLTVELNRSIIVGSTGS